MRWFVFVSAALLALAAAGCGLAAATHAKQGALSLATRGQWQQQQQQPYYLPPVQRYIYLNGVPYAILNEEIKYVSPAQAAYAQPGVVAPSTYTAPGPSAYSAAAPPSDAATASFPSAYEAPTPSPSAYEAPAPSAYSAPAPSPAAYPAPAFSPSAYVAPAPESPLVTPGPVMPQAASQAQQSDSDSAVTEPTVNSASPAADAEVDSVASGTVEVATKLAEPAIDVQEAVASSTVETRHEEPAAAAAPAAPAASYVPGPRPTIYLSGASQPSFPSAQQAVRLTMSNPKVTVHRTETVYSWRHPPQAVNPPVVLTFSNDKQAGPQKLPITTTSSTPFTFTLGSEPSLVQATAASSPSATLVQWVDPSQPRPYAGQGVAHGDGSAASEPVPTYLQPSATANSQPSSGLTGYSGYSGYSGYPSAQPQPGRDLFSYTLSQSPLVRMVIDPVTGVSYFVDSENRRIDLPALAAAAGSPASDSEAASRLLQPLSSSGSSGSSGSGAGGDFKIQDMTALQPVRAPFVPKTYQPVPPRTNYDRPITVSISTGRDAAAAAQSAPLSPGDYGPSRGDSADADNPARPQELW